MYHNMPYDKVVAVEAVFAKYAATMAQAMEPIVQRSWWRWAWQKLKPALRRPQIPNGTIR